MSNDFVMTMPIKYRSAAGKARVGATRIAIPIVDAKAAPRAIRWTRRLHGTENNFEFRLHDGWIYHRHLETQTYGAITTDTVTLGRRIDDLDTWSASRFHPIDSHPFHPVNRRVLSIWGEDTSLIDYQRSEDPEFLEAERRTKEHVRNFIVLNDTVWRRGLGPSFGHRYRDRGINGLTYGHPAEGITPVQLMHAFSFGERELVAEHMRRAYGRDLKIEEPLETLIESGYRRSNLDILLDFAVWQLLFATRSIAPDRHNRHMAQATVEMRQALQDRWPGRQLQFMGLHSYHTVEQIDPVEEAYPSGEALIDQIERWTNAFSTELNDQIYRETKLAVAYARDAMQLRTDLDGDFEDFNQMTVPAL